MTTSNNSGPRSSDTAGSVGPGPALQTPAAMFRIGELVALRSDPDTVLPIVDVFEVGAETRYRVFRHGRRELLTAGGGEVGRHESGVEDAGEKACLAREPKARRARAEGLGSALRRARASRTSGLYRPGDRWPLRRDGNRAFDPAGLDPGRIAQGSRERPICAGRQAVVARCRGGSRGRARILSPRSGSGRERRGRWRRRRARIERVEADPRPQIVRSPILGGRPATRAGANGLFQRIVSVRGSPPAGRQDPPYVLARGGDRCRRAGPGPQPL